VITGFAERATGMHFLVVVAAVAAPRPVSRIGIIPSAEGTQVISRFFSSISSIAILLGCFQVKRAAIMR